MASEIKVDTIVNAGGDNDTGIDLATNDQILLKVANATRLTMNSTGQTTIVGEGGTTTTSLQQGLCKVWCHWNASTAIQDSFNVSAISDDGTGITTITYSNNMANDDYAGGGMSRLNDGGGNAFMRFSNVYTTSQNKFVCTDVSSGLIDALTQTVLLKGDLA